MNSPRSSPSLTLFEKAVLAHVMVLMLAATWLFGGNIWWSRPVIAGWASLAAPLAVAAFCQRGAAGRDARRKAWWLAPGALFSALVIASAFNPSFSTTIIESDAVMARTGAARPGWPSTVNAGDSLASLWLGAGIWLSAFNLALVIRSRTALRLLLVLIVGNAFALAVFGTVQKLAGAGYYFGAAVSPNARFFSTFIYNNHWGAFMILALTAAAGLLFYHARKYQGRDLWHSPFSVALVGFLVIAVSAPVSASRAATGMTLAVAAIVSGHALLRIISSRRRERRPAWPSVLLFLSLILAVCGATGWLAYRSLGPRYAETRIVLEKKQPVFGERAALYRDTWELARQQPVFGWGLDSYDIAFQLIRPRPVHLRRQYENSYATAHNDWLQSVVETGFVGTGLLLLVLIVPLAGHAASLLRHPLSAYPLLGMIIVLAYAGIEFPFANGAFFVTFCVLLFILARHAQLTASLSRHE